MFALLVHTRPGHPATSPPLLTAARITALFVIFFLCSLSSAPAPQRVLTKIQSIEKNVLITYRNVWWQETPRTVHNIYSLLCTPMCTQCCVQILLMLNVDILYWLAVSLTRPDYEPCNLLMSSHLKKSKLAAATDEVRQQRTLHDT